MTLSITCSTPVKQPRRLHRLPLILALASAALLSACGSDNDNDNDNYPAPFMTLKEQQPLVIAHRGASGYIP